MAKMDLSGSWKTIIMVVLLAVFGLFLFSKFTTQGAEGIEFNTAVDAGGVALTVFKLLIIGMAVFFGYALAVKVSGGALSRRDAFTLILVGIGLWFLWDKFLSGIFGADTLEDIGKNTLAMINK